MILGTAGHVDHGKTALIRALTGVDTDRLPEEKRRGITIELGFAPLSLEGFGVLGVVDVPGHEAFVRTMLAGATGVDLALLVVAADEGVMPQTTEHLAILTLLGVRGGVVAISKCDLVDDEWLRLVESEVRDTLGASPLADAPIVPVSAATGQGLDQLRSALASTAATLGRPPEADLFRMPVDRVFTLRGTGTVVTGTVWSGELRRGAAWIYPPGRGVRVRDLHSHGVSTESVRRGERAAVALADAGAGEIPRGAVLVSTADWRPTTTVRAALTLLDTADLRLGPRTAVRFHLGSVDAGARVVQLGEGMVRVHLDTPLLCRGGDRFVLRGGPRLTTLGGGTVLDPWSPRRARALPLVQPGGIDLLRALCSEAGAAGVERATLSIRLGMRPAGSDDVLNDPALCVTDERVYSAGLRDTVSAAILDAVDSFHAGAPLASGVALQEVRAAAAVPADLFDLVLDQLLGQKQLSTSGGIVHRPGWVPQLDDGQARLAERMMHAFCSGSELLTETEVEKLFGSTSLPVLRYLERQGSVIRLGEALVGAEPVVRTMVERLCGAMDPGRGYTPAELRDALGVSRKVLIPLLEYCDRVRITERRGSERILRGGKH